MICVFINSLDLHIYKKCKFAQISSNFWNLEQSNRPRWEKTSFRISVDGGLFINSIELKAIACDVRYKRMKYMFYFGLTAHQYKWYFLGMKRKKNQLIVSLFRLNKLFIQMNVIRICVMFVNQSWNWINKSPFERERKTHTHTSFAKTISKFSLAILFYHIRIKFVYWFYVGDDGGKKLMEFGFGRFRF